LGWQSLRTNTISGAAIDSKERVMFYMAGLGNYRNALDAVSDTNYATMLFDREVVTA
jgi:hypothetical protein